jgi:hypothetical protein
LRIVASDAVNTSGILKLLSGKKEIKVVNLSMDKSEDEFIFELVLEVADISIVTGIMTQLHEDPTVKEVFWNK